MRINHAIAMLTLLGLSACAGTFGQPVPVPTTRIPITVETDYHRHSRPKILLKGDAQLDGCGDRMMQAVAGVPAAEALIAKCHSRQIASMWLLAPDLAGGALAATSLFMGNGGRRDAFFITGGALVLGTLIAEFVLALRGGDNVQNAVDLYNASVPN